LASLAGSGGKDLDKDPEFQQRIADPEQRRLIYGESTSLLGKTLTSGQWTAMWIFLGAIALVALLGAYPGMRPVFDGKPMSMVLAIQMFMLLAGTLIILFTPHRCVADWQNRGVSRRHDCGGGGVWCGLDGRHRV
jgi:anaerobic C4-dicarboxylate transporter